MTYFDAAELLGSRLRKTDESPAQRYYAAYGISMESDVCMAFSVRCQKEQAAIAEVGSLDG